MIGKYGSFMNALALAFGAWYVFNIQYPDAAMATLEFIQRCFLGINPDAGLKTSKRKKNSTVNPKVLKLIYEFSDFEWTYQN